MATDAINTATLVLTIVFGLVGLSLAAFVLSRGPGLVLNRVLAALFFFEGSGAFNDGTRLGGASMAWQQAGEVWFQHFSYPVLWPLYLMFIFHALPTPGTRWMRTPVARWVLIGCALASVAAANTWDVSQNIWRLTTISSSLLGLVWAFRHWRRSSGAVRRKARAFLIAFGLRDAGFIVGLGLLLGAAAAGHSTEPGETLAADVGNLLVVVGLGAYAVALGIGILRAQLLDFEFQFHKGISRTTIAAIFVAVFFVVSELAANLMSEQFGPIIGITATGLLVFAISPLMRLGDKVGDAVVDDARPLSERTPAEHLALYRDQVELALEDGQMSSKEIRMLEKVRARLNVPADVAMELQAEVAQIQSRRFGSAAAV